MNTKQKNVATNSHPKISKGAILSVSLVLILGILLATTLFIGGKSNNSNTTWRTVRVLTFSDTCQFVDDATLSNRECEKGFDIIAEASGMKSVFKAERYKNEDERAQYEDMKSKIEKAANEDALIDIETNEQGIIISVR